MTSNVDAIYLEYPFLSKFKPRNQVSSATVSRWNEEFLQNPPGSYPDSGYEKLYLVDENGTIVARVVGPVEKYFAWFSGTYTTVGQTLSRMSDEEKQRVKYAVGVWNRSMTLSKLPRGYNNAADWLAKMIDRARKKL